MIRALFTLALLVGCALSVAADVYHPTGRATAGVGINQHTEQSMQHNPYVGMWVTGDGRIRQELLPNNRYDEARGSRRSAYQGRYEIRGNEIFYWDDTGFTADGTFVNDDELHHGGMNFYRER
jgi:hypothetical protein